jgi:hypothetical protein
MDGGGRESQALLHGALQGFLVGRGTESHGLADLVVGDDAISVSVRASLRGTGASPGG